MKLGDIEADESSFSFRDLQDLDVWTPFTPVFGSLTVVGATSYSGRLNIRGRQCFFQVKFSAATSISSVAGTTYLTLPAESQGLSGEAKMANRTAHTGVDGGELDADLSRFYLPTQTASGNVFTITGWYEV